MVRIGVVVQRYGEDVIGGAETLSRDISERLNASGFDVTVFTTTAKDYITWKNHYKSGETILKGVVIRRFPVDVERDMDVFNTVSSSFFNPNNKKDITEEEWIDLQGPVSTKLVDTIQDEQDKFDIFIFFTYLYYTTVKTLKVLKKPSVLFPTAHEEPPINMKLMKDVFEKPDALFFLTGAEMDLVKNKFSLIGRTILSRTGVDIKRNVDESLFRRHYGIVSPFMLYAGRIEKGKGLEVLFDAFVEIRKKNMIDLVLMGKKLMDIPESDGIKYVGFVSEEDKASAFRGAVCSVQPSPMESLSITTLESFSQETPVLVNSACEVLMEHIKLSGGGLPFGNSDELIESFNTIYTSRNKRNLMGRIGFDYVKKYYSWDEVIRRISIPIREISNKKN